MRHLLILFCSLIISAPLFADATAPIAAAVSAPSVTPAPSVAPKDVPTKESINKLLLAMNVETYVAESQHKLDASMKSGLDRSLQGKNLSPEMRNKIDTLQKNNSTILADAFAWPLMQAMYDQVYSETFTQSEIDDLTVFYNSPTGKAFLTKMPLATRRTMVIMQQRMGPVIQRMQQSIQQTTLAAVTVSQGPATPVPLQVKPAPTPVPVPTAVPVSTPKPPTL